MKRTYMIAGMVALAVFCGLGVAAMVDPGLSAHVVQVLFTPEVGAGLMVANAPVAVSELKALNEQLAKAFNDFKSETDKLLKAKAEGKAVADLEAKVDRINAEMDRLEDLRKDMANVSERVASLALEGGAGAGGDEERRHVELFNRLHGTQMDVEGLRNYRKSLNTYMRRGEATPADVKAALSVGSDPDGGYTVTPDMSGRIIQRVFETSPMRQLATVDTISTDAMEGFNDLDEADTGGWVSEMSASRDSETGTPQLGKWQIPVHEQYAMPKTTQKLLDDSSWDVEGWLIRKVGDKFTRYENSGFYTGNGVGKPRGICNYTTVATADGSRAWGQFEHVPTGVNGAFAGTDPGDDLIDLVFKLKAAYRNNAVWQMARTTLAAVRKLKDGQGNYLWQPNFQERQGGLLLGFPVVEAEDMPTMASGSLSIAFGDFREGYQIVDRLGIRVLRDPYTSKGFVKFFCTRRVGGGALNFEAIKFLKFATS